MEISKDKIQATNNSFNEFIKDFFKRISRERGVPYEDLLYEFSIGKGYYRTITEDILKSRLTV